MIDRDRELLCLVSRVNKGMGTAALRLMDEIEDGHLPSSRLRELGELLGDLSQALATRADEIEGAPPRAIGSPMRTGSRIIDAGYVE